MKLSKFLFEAIEDFQSKRFKDLESGAKKKEFNIKKASEDINTFEDLKKIIDETDPTGGTYKRWLYDKWFGGGFKTEDKDKVKDYLKSFHANRTKLPKDFQDIGGIQTSGQLFAVLKDNGFIGLETSKIDPVAISKLEANGDIEPLGEDGQWIGWIIKTLKGSCALGKDTEWCTAKYGEQDGRNMFSDYHGQGPLYVFIRKTSGTPSKIQLHFYTNQFMDENDKPIEIPDQVYNILLKNVDKLSNNDPDFLMHAIKNPKTKLDMLQKLLKKVVNSGVLKFISQIVLNPNMSPELLRELARKFSNDKEFLLRIGLNPNAPQELLTNLDMSEIENSTTLLKIARNKNTPPEVLTKLFESKDKNIRKAIIENPNTPPSILENLSEDEITIGLTNPKMPSNILAKYAQSKDRRIITLVSKNPNTPPNSLLEIINNNPEDTEILETVAFNPNLPPEGFKLLATNNDEYVLRGVVSNANIPPEILELLAKSTIRAVVLNVASNLKTPPNILADLAKSTIRGVGWNVASNPNTPQETLKMLANVKNQDRDILEALVGNTKTPPEILQRLKMDPRLNESHKPKRISLSSIIFKN